MRRTAVHVNGSRSAEWKALANVRKHRKTLGYKKKRGIFTINIDVQFDSGPEAPTRQFNSVRNGPQTLAARRNS